MIYRTNLLTRWPVPVLVFCCLFVSEKLFVEVSRNQLESYMIYFYEETKTEPGGDLQGPHRPQTPPRSGSSWTTARAHLGASGTSPSFPFAYKSPSS